MGGGNPTEENWGKGCDKEKFGNRWEKRFPWKKLDVNPQSLKKKTSSETLRKTRKSLLWGQNRAPVKNSSRETQRCVGSLPNTKNNLREVRKYLKPSNKGGNAKKGTPF